MGVESFQQQGRGGYGSAAPEGLARKVGSGILAALKATGSTILHALALVWRKSKLLATVLLVVVIALCWFLLDSSFTANKIYKGVHVGSVDVSNMTVDEAATAINDAYSQNLYSTSIYIFADEEAANSPDLDMRMIESESQAELKSFEEAQKEKKLWITSAKDLEATIPAYDLAEEALKVGRGVGFLQRIDAASAGIDIDVKAHFDETLLGNLISDINSTLGYDVQDYGVKIEGNTIEVTEGSTGYVLDDEEFSNLISDNLLADDSPIVSLIADVKYTPYKIDEETAWRTRNAIDALVPESASFTAEGQTFDVDRNTMLGWVSTEAKWQDGRWFLNPYIDGKPATRDIMSMANTDETGVSVKVEFVPTGKGEILVRPESEVAVPNVNEALRRLDSMIFDDFRKSGNIGSAPDVGTIDIVTEQHSGDFSVDEAVDFGLVSEFSTYTTQYTNTTSTENRAFNVHLAADKISNSIAKADGGQWSFNDVAGSCDAESGFREAKVIESGNYTEGIGGGICQVATTVFNAVYEAGLPVDERHNHSLYSSSYPAGRDAAIAYPTMDLIWSNPTESDILLVTNYTDNSVTVTLIGADPGRTVETTTGDWVDGKKHGTEWEEDEFLGANASYVKTAGTDGMDISVIRRVKGQDGEVLIEDNFISSYSPINRVIAFGKGSDMASLREKYMEKEG